MCLSTSCIHLVSYVGSPRWPLHNFLRLCCFNIRISPAPLGSQQLPACIWFQYLGFPCLSTTSCAHLVSISNFPPLPLIKLPKLPAFIGFQHLYGSVGFPTSFPFCPLLLNFYSSHLRAPLGGIHLVSISRLLPPLCLSAISRIHAFGFKTSPLVS